VPLDREKTAYAKAVLRRQYTGPSATSGVLVSGKFYRITSFVSGDDFSNVGATTVRCYGNKGHTGSVFAATATTPTVWTHGSKLTELKVAELRAKADSIFAEASEQIAITAGSFEGGQGSGQIVFEKSILGLAIEELLAEFDPDYTPGRPRASGFVMQFGGCGN
jgi:hypothetical protein